MKKLLLAIIVAVLSDYGAGLKAHEYNMSIGFAEYNPKTSAWELVIQLFNHDLDPILQKACKKKKQCDREKFVKDHVVKNLSLKQGEKVLKEQWIGIDWGVRQTHLYLEFASKNPSPPEVKNTILKEYYPLQQNRIDFKGLDRGLHNNQYHGTQNWGN